MPLKVLNIGDIVSRTSLLTGIRCIRDTNRLTPAVQVLVLKANPLFHGGFNVKRSLFTSSRVPQIEIRKSGGDVAPKTKSEKAKQAAKDTSYGLIILFGVSCMGFVFYVLYKELLSKAGPTQVFGDALEKCRSNKELSVALGSPIEGFGETNSRGRRRHVSHLAYIDAQGRDAMRMKFYIKGSSGRTGTVQVDSVVVGRKISYRYVIAYLDIYPRRIVIVVDERSELDKGSAIEEIREFDE